jgi:Flp pilus assembly protein TadD
LSRLWFRKRKPEEAVKVLRQMTAANPKDADTHARCAALLLSLSMPHEALRSIETACRLQPKEFRFHIVRGDLLLRAKKIDEAIAARRLAIGLIPAGTMQQQQVGYFVSLSLSAGRLETRWACSSSAALRRRAATTHARGIFSSGC